MSFSCSWVAGGGATVQLLCDDLGLADGVHGEQHPVFGGIHDTCGGQGHTGLFPPTRHQRASQDQ